MPTNARMRANGPATATMACTQGSASQRRGGAAGGGAEAGLAATRLGQGPFDYRVELDLDGTTHVGRATWPGDEIEDYAPYAALTWTPPLPVHTG